MKLILTIATLTSLCFSVAGAQQAKTPLSKKTELIVEEAPPNEAPYADPEQAEEDADLAGVAGEPETQELTNTEPDPSETTSSPEEIPKGVQGNPYSEGEFQGRKDRFGRPDPRNRSFSKENDDLVRKGLLKISKTGEFIYTYPESPQTQALAIRAGTFSAPSLTNPDTGQTFQSVYGSAEKLMFVFEYEWQLLKLPIGKLGLAVATGLYTTSGNGFYRKPELQPSPRAEEVYSFYIFPNSISAIYRLQFSDRQILVPYGTAGLDYFGILETRDDGGSTKFGGGAGFHVGFGGSMQLDFLSKQSMFDLDQEFGINHIYLTVDFRYVQGIASTFNITQNLLTGGILAEF